MSSPNFIPKRRLLSGVTVASRCVVTTTEDHGYSVGQSVDMHVPKRYGMSLPGITAKITAIPTATTFILDLDTVNQAPFVAPTAPPFFTPAQVVPADGLYRNYTSITGVSGAA